MADKPKNTFPPPEKRGRGRPKKTPVEKVSLLPTGEERKAIRELAERDFLYFIHLVAPWRLVAHCHESLCNWWTREEALTNQMLLWPRDHAKSWFVGMRCVWRIVNDPCVRILYLSSTSNLAEKQLKLIKDILTSDIFMHYWPEYINAEEGKREKWTLSEISIDHPIRKTEGMRDSTVTTGGLTTSLTGLHCDVTVLDDVVVKENAYTRDGRDKVAEQYSLIASIEGAEAEQWVVGTRYHPKDLYGMLKDMTEDVFDKEGEVTSKRHVFEVFEQQVEDKGDGTGNFLWPRTARPDGKWFGFNKEILARKRAQYIDKTQFRAQYYNDPNDTSEARVNRNRFQYYEKSHLSRTEGHWYLKEKRLNVYASMDFAFTTTKQADFTAIVVVGIDPDGFIYILDIERFKTNKISEYYEKILGLLVKWGFRKLRAEVSVAQEIIVKDLKENYIRPNGLALSIDEHRPTRSQGSKEERIAAVLEPRYNNLSIYHFKGGNCELLEEELLLQNPPHDDIKDALASVIEICIPPQGHRNRSNAPSTNVLGFNSRFGGIS